ncbi:acyl-CoA thioesterase [Salinicola corii]|uniref:Acyl-CoA thioesterase n=1 Tax=Salinicola corii TaxID=2606937 RepID=A0A640WJT3_9GAMM|nr:thioesterase family protein [Salinicola corii]KAA0020909.1 acyl-CoA thioesterase [Salinicola corii]
MDSRITVTEVRVRGFHLDGYGHVNHARYLEFLEEGRWAYVDAHPEFADGLARGVALVAVNLNIDYRRAAVMNDDLKVETCLTRVGGRSGVVGHRITHIGSGELVAAATLTFVLLDQQSGQVVPMEGEWAERLEPLVVDAPEGK